jgi:hypothetical protein
VLESQPAAASPPASPPPLVAAAAKEIADDVVGAARALAVHLEAWIDFTVLALDDVIFISSILTPTRWVGADIFGNGITLQHGLTPYRFR